MLHRGYRAPHTIDWGDHVMLSTDHKANILHKAGYAVPAKPGSADSSYQTAQCWEKAIDTLYVSYSASRAAKSLRDAEEARMLALLQLRSTKAYA
jgi:hypothetical protein